MSAALIKSCGNCLVVHAAMAFVIGGSSSQPASQPASERGRLFAQRPGGWLARSDANLIMHVLLRRGRWEIYPHTPPIFFLLLYFCVHFDVGISIFFITLALFLWDRFYFFLTAGQRVEFTFLLRFILAAGEDRALRGLELSRAARRWITRPSLDRDEPFFSQLTCL